MGKGGDSGNTATETRPQPQPAVVPPTASKPSSEEHHGVYPYSDFLWSDHDEPHATRRKQILAKYPQIKELYGPDPIFKYKVLLALSIQFSLAYFFRNQIVFGTDAASEDKAKQPWWLFWTLAYVVGGTMNHMLMMALHELSHNLGFKHPKDNQKFAMLANIPLGIPSAVTFKRYHMDHHKYQGVQGMDVDVPTFVEGKIFQNTFTKFWFVVFQMAFYAFRPAFVHPKKPSVAEAVNAMVAITADALMVYFWGPGALFYCLMSTWLGMGMHPVAGHFIAEHYVFPEDVDKQVETYSYYGFCNYFTFNVGYHNEHHDFPFVPGSRLPQVKKIAPEFYDHLHCHTSYVYVILSYIFNPKITAFSRVMRTMEVQEAATKKRQ